MNKIISILIFCLCAVVSAEQTILFLGDSNTARGAYIKLIDAELKQEHGDKAPKLIKSGISGETISGLSEKDHPGRRKYVHDRLDKELKKHKPDWVVACYGINCGIYHPYSEERFTKYKEGVNKLIKKVNESGAKLILITPPPYAVIGPNLTGDEQKDQALIVKATKEANAKAEADPMAINYKRPFVYYDTVMATYSTWILTLADHEKNIWTVDIRTPLLQNADEYYGKDRIHYNKKGHKAIADTFIVSWKKINSQ